MADPVAIEPAALAALNDQLWRRLGITQTFDRLLVETVARQPGSTEDVRENAGRTLTGGAARFYQMSFAQLLKDLCRRNVLAERAGQIGLDHSFADRLKRLVGDTQAGASRVEPTPGITLEDVLHGVEQRAEREKLLKAAGRRAAKAPKDGDKAAPKKGASPRKRSTPAAEGEGLPASSTPAPNPARPVEGHPGPAHRTPAAQLFTSIRLNKLLDTLDTNALNREALDKRLGLHGGDLERFLSVCEASGLTRTNGSMVELHWNGKELARTAAADRRMAVIDVVKSLRDKAAELDA